LPVELSSGNPGSKRFIFQRVNLHYLFLHHIIVIVSQNLVKESKSYSLFMEDFFLYKLRLFKAIGFLAFNDNVKRRTWLRRLSVPALPDK